MHPRPTSGSASVDAQDQVSQLHVTLLDIGGSTSAALKFLKADPHDPAQLAHLSEYLHEGCAIVSLTTSLTTLTLASNEPNE